MSRIGAALGRGVARARLLLWSRRAQRRMGRHGCELTVVLGRGVTFDALPVVEATRQALGPDAPGGRGSVRIEVGPGVHLGRGTVVEVLPSADALLVLGDGAVCFAGVRLVLFGGEVHVGRGTRLRDGVSLKSSGRLQVGAHGFVNAHAAVHCAEEVVLGEHPQVAERVTIIDSDHQADGSGTFTQLLPIATTPVAIGRNVWIGANAVVLRGARIGENAVVAANSTVRAGDYAAGWLVAGSPAAAKRAL